MSYRDNYKLIDFSKEIVLPVKREKVPPARSSLPAPRIASDHMEPVQSQLDCKLYDSKSALRATYRQAGVVEVGNDTARNRPFKRPETPRKEIKDDVLIGRDILQFCHLVFDHRTKTYTLDMP